MFRLFGPVFVVAVVALWIFTIAQIIKTPDGAFKNGNQMLWLVLVILVPPVGVALYWIMGAPQSGRW